MKEGITIFKCENIGVSGTTNVVVKKHDEANYEARCGIALFGVTNMSDLQLDQCDRNPFHNDFHDNCSIGVGETEELAIESMKQNMKAIAESLWV